MKTTFKTIALVLVAAMMLSSMAFALASNPMNQIPSGGVGVGVGILPGSSSTPAANTAKVEIVKPANGSITVTYKNASNNTVAFTSTSYVPIGTTITITATPASASYKLGTITVDGGTVVDNSTKVISTNTNISATFTYDATAAPSGGSAAYKSYLVNAICTGSSNCQNFYTSGRNATYAKYLFNGGAGAANNEIVAGDYVDLTVIITDADYDKIDPATAQITTPNASAFKTTNYTTSANGFALNKNTDGYTVTLPALYYNGSNGNLVLSITCGTYSAWITVPVQNATVTPEASNDDKPTTPDSAKPYVIISSYSYGGKDLVAGETRNVTMTFSNTSKSIAVENMMVTMSLPGDSMVLTSSSNTFYVENLGAGKSISKTVNITVKPTAPAQSQAMTVSFTYDYLDGDTRKSASTEENISMPVVQVDRFTVTGIELQDTLFQNEEGSLTVNFVNKGRSDVYNISAKVNCPGLLNDGEEQYIGNLTTGTTSSADFYITAQQSGTISGEVVITYENTNMEQCSVTVPFSASVMSYEDAYGPSDPGIDDPGMMDPVEPQSSTFPWYWIVLGVFVVGGVVFAIVKHKKNKENVDEDEDY